METFLKQVARRIADAHPKDTDRVLVVMNNRRSVRFFQRQFNGLGRPMFLPHTMVIDDLVAELGGLEIVPNEFLLFELYRIHTELGGEERKYKTFDEFISFGDLMLGDFSEIDQYCVDARDLFGNLHDLKGIREWDIEGSELTPFQRDYLTFYRSLYDYYRLLHERLLAQGKAYSGMAYRNVAENISGQWSVVSGQWKAVYFVGFNALSECERRIIGEFVHRGIGHLLTDGDPYFLAPEQEAGHFLRKHMDEFPEIRPTGTSLFGQGERKITIVECPEALLQCKYAGQLLEKSGQLAVSSEQKADALSTVHCPLTTDDTAVVLADESLLLPPLNSLPDTGDDYHVNISMGYAYTDSNMHQLAQKLFTLHRRRNDRGYYCVDVLEVLGDPYIERLLGAHGLRHRATHFLEEGNYIRCQAADIRALITDPQLPTTHYPLHTLFPDNPLTVDGWIASLTQFVAQLVQSGLLESNNKERQAAGSLAEILAYLAELQQAYHYIENFDTLEKIYSRISRRHNIALIGEPLSGLQILGVLETRNLDFRRVILLSTNEGMLPAGRSGNTLIPHELKQAFGLPTYREKDSVYAYNFYHLLLRAEEVYLLFSSQSEAMGKGEASRFIRQVESELAPRFGITVEHVIVNNNEPPKEAESGEQKVEKKSEALMEKLRAMADRGFTPTSFDDYLECPLRYCYTQVLSISEEEDLDNDLDASQLGTCIHNVLEKIYAPYVGRTVEAAGLRQALTDLPQLMEAEFREYYLHGRDTEGRNRFYHSVAETQLRNLLQKEIALLEQGHQLEMVAVEQMIEPPYLLGQTPDGAPLRLRGKVDRIDRLDGRLRIIDYKTGHLDDKEIAYSSTPNRNGEVVVPGKWFQLMCYALLYSRSGQWTVDSGQLSAGIYPLRHLQSGVRLASWDGSTDITPAMLDDFEGLLRDLCLELLNPDVPFRAATHKDACRYCDVRSFCPLRP